MKKLLFILALCLSVFASAQCPVGNLTQNAKWKFVFSQCMQDTLTLTYTDTSKIAFIDGNGNLTTITYAALLDSLNVPDPTYPDSSVLFVGSDGKPTTDSANFVWDNDNNALRIGTPNPTFISGSLVSTRLLTSSTSQAQATFLNYLATNSTTGASNYPLLQFVKTRGTVAVPTALSATDQNRNFGGVSFGSYDGTSFINNSAQIRVGSPRNWAVGQTPSYFEFWTTPSNSTTAVRSVFFTHTGGIAIGSNWADTTFKLTVNGTAAVVITPPSTNGEDTLIVKHGTTGQLLGATLNSMLDTINAPSVTGSDAFSAFRINQTWNTTGSPTGIFANFTNTNSGSATNIIDLQVSTASMFRVSKVGGVTTGSTITSGSGLTMSGGGLLQWTNRSAMISQDNGTILMSNNAITDFGRLKLGGSTSAFPSIARQGQAIRLLLADTSGFAQLQTGQLSVNGVPQASAAVTINSTTQGFLPPVMTAAQGSAIATPAQGLMIFVTTTNGTFTAVGWWGFDGANWVQIG